MKDRKPNHKCAVCGAEYWSCDYCSRIHSWRSLCDTRECYEKLLQSREPAKEQRLDKTPEEMEVLMVKDIEEVKKDTLEELSDVADIITEEGIAGAVDVINKEMKKKRKTSQVKSK